jgi:phosphoribosylanthranilate isomerase
VSKVKICGLRRPEDIKAVNRVLPDFIGFVFAPSKRKVEAKTAAMLKELLDPRIKAVGVFVNENIDVVSALYLNHSVDFIQLHGDEDGAYILRLKEKCGCPVIKAVSVGDSLPPLPAEADYLLFDTFSARRGGTGRAFDWNILKHYRGLPYFLAGGLSPDNISDVFERLSPFCVDVSSGVETDGLKDMEKIEKFVRLVRRPARSLPP